MKFFHIIFPFRLGLSKLNLCIVINIQLIIRQGIRSECATDRRSFYAAPWAAEYGIVFLVECLQNVVPIGNCLRSLQALCIQPILPN